MHDERPKQPKTVSDRRLDEIFGRELETDEADTDNADRAHDDTWYRDNRPPHHDR